MLGFKRRNRYSRKEGHVVKAIGDTYNIYGPLSSKKLPIEVLVLDKGTIFILLVFWQP